MLDYDAACSPLFNACKFDDDMPMSLAMWRATVGLVDNSLHEVLSIVDVTTVWELSPWDRPG